MTRRNRLAVFATAYGDQSDHSDEVTFTLPEDITSISDDAVNDLLTDALAAIDAVIDSAGDTPSNDDVAALEQLTEAVEALRSEDTRRESERAEARAKVAELADRARPVQPAVDDNDDATTEDETPEVVAEAEEIVEEAAEAAEPELVAASAAPRKPISVTLRGLSSRKQPEPIVEDDVNPNAASLLAAADVPGLTTGSQVTFRQLAEAAMRRGSGASSAADAAAKSGREYRQQFGLASIKLATDPKADISAGADPREAIKYATDETRLPGGSLVAAGGWCAPSESLGFIEGCDISLDGLVDWPTITATRGGFRYTRGVSFSDVFDDPAWICVSEAEAEVDAWQDISAPADGINDPGTTKPCATIECPTEEEFRLCVSGWCAEAPILTRAAAPEVIEDYLSKFMTAYQHRLDANHLATAIAGSTAVNFAAAGDGSAASLLGAVAITIEDMRYANRLSRARSLVVTMPYYALNIIRGDLARRNGDKSYLSVSESEVRDWFAQRGAIVRWSVNLNPMGTGAPATQWPNDVSFLVHPADHWVLAQQDVISLDTVYDSTLLARNAYTAVFAETGHALHPLGGCESRYVTVSGACESGVTGLPADLCPTGI